MRILTYAWYIYDSRLQQYASNCTGGGLVVRDLCEFLGRKEESYLFIGQYVFPEMKLGNINLVKTDYVAGIEKAKGRDVAYIEYMTKVFERAVEEINPDIIHFHDSGDLAYSIIENVCIPKKLTYAMTCHLYIGKTPPFAGYEKSSFVEERMMGLPDLNLVTVSTGMKRKILRDYPEYDEKRITPILNGTDFKADYLSSDYRQSLCIGNRKVLVCAGTICYRKNQLQILRVFERYPELKKEIFIIFCGNIANAMDENFEEEIKRRGLDSCMQYVGALSGEEMKKIYSAADGLIMPSHAEGLSISALESVSYGLPIVMFRDSECADDLNDDDVVSFAENRSDEGLMNAIANWYDRRWNKGRILEYSKFYSMERMTEDYLRYYRNLI